MNKCSLCGVDDSPTNFVLDYDGVLLCSECAYYLQDAQEEENCINELKINLP